MQTHLHCSLEELSIGWSGAVDENNTAEATQHDITPHNTTQNNTTQLSQQVAYGNTRIINGQCHWKRL